MTVMRWFRKHNKKLMVGIGLVVMVAFGLPTTLFRTQGQRNPAEVVEAHFTDFTGQNHEITVAQIQVAERDLNVLRSLGLIEMTVNQGAIRQLSGLGGVGEFPIWAANLVLFPEDAFIRQGLLLWLQIMSQSDWAEDSEEYQELQDKVVEMCGVEPGMSVRYFVLLSEEARQAGITTPQAHIDAMKNLFRRSQISINAICNQFKISEKQFDRILADYISIIRYGDMVTRTLALSEPHLKKAALNKKELETVSGMYVTFSAGNFLDRVPEPNEGDLIGQLNQYKQYRPGETTEENPFGFGYKLADRVRLEYLQVDLDEARKMVRQRFNQLPVRQQEEQLQNYWRSHRSQFRELIKAATDTEPEEYRELGFDEAAGQVRRVREDDEAQRWAQRLLSQAKDESQRTLNRTELNAMSLAERKEKAVNYEVLAQQVSEADLTVAYGKTDFLDFNGFNNSEEFAGAFQQRSRGVQMPVSSMVFNSEPLYKGVRSRLDEPPIQLFEDIDSVVTPNQMTGDNLAIYLLRIIEVDKEREPVSLLDDGLQGAAVEEIPEISIDQIEQELNDPNAPLDIYSLYQSVKNDWQMLQAFKLARRQAEEFAAAAESDWDGAVKAYNTALTADPNDYGALSQTLWENSLESARTQIMQYQQQMESFDDQMKQFFQSSIMQLQIGLQEAMELAQERPADAIGPALMVREGKRECWVFKNLRVAPPSIGEYRRQKPIIANELSTSNQGLMCLWHFNPENIKKRTKYELQVIE